MIKANDQPKGVLTNFKLEPFDFGLDEDGESSLTRRHLAVKREMRDKSFSSFESASGYVTCFTTPGTACGLATGKVLITACWRLSI